MKTSLSFAASEPRNTKILENTGNSVTVLYGKESGGISIPGINETGKRYVYGDVTLLEEHCVPFMFRVFAKGEEEERLFYRFGILPGVKIRVCFDLDLLDMRTIFTTRRPGLLKIVCHGHRITRDEIDFFEMGMDDCFHDVKVKLEDFFASDEEPEEYPVPNVPLVDEFGQWKNKEWPGKVHNMAELEETVRGNEGPLKWPSEDWDKWGGNLKRKLAEGTGFFSTKKVDGRWYLVDPDGYEFFSNGVCHVCMHTEDKIDGLEPFFEKLPERGGEFEKFYSDFTIQRKPYMPIEHRINFNWAKSNVYKVYGENWEEKWRENTYHILSHAGMNTMGSHPDTGWNFGEYGLKEYCENHNVSTENFRVPAVKIPYVQKLTSFPVTKKMIFRDFPDVLSPEYEEASLKYAEECAYYVGDPYLIGYFMTNEPEFNFVENLCIADEILYNPMKSYCRAGLKKWLMEKYETIGNLNAAWGASFESFDAFDEVIRDCSKISAKAERDLRDYSVILMRTYIRIPAEAIKKVDPDHLNLGMRWSKAYNADMCAGWEYCDCFTINCYSFDPTIDMNFAVKAGVDCPIILGEFHMGALDRGLLATGLKGVASQEDRAKAWRFVCEQVAAHPYGVGAHWHMFCDNSVAGWYDGENYNNGMIDVCTRPYKELNEAMNTSMQSIYEVYEGKKAPYSEKAEKIPMIAY